MDTKKDTPTTPKPVANPSTKTPPTNPPPTPTRAAPVKSSGGGHSWLTTLFVLYVDYCTISYVCISSS